MCNECNRWLRFLFVHWLGRLQGLKTQLSSAWNMYFIRESIEINVGGGNCCFLTRLNKGRGRSKEGESGNTRSSVERWVLNSRCCPDWTLLFSLSGLSLRACWAWMSMKPPNSCWFLCLSEREFGAEPLESQFKAWAKRLVWIPVSNLWYVMCVCWFVIYQTNTKQFEKDI